MYTKLIWPLTANKEHTVSKSIIVYEILTNVTITTRLYFI